MRAPEQDISMEMSYEAYLDEVTTLLTEMFDVSEEAAIKHVMRAQAADFFTLHDDIPAMRTQERAVQDAKTIFQQMQQSRKPAPSQQAGKRKK
jgi:hypothetical protein